MKKDETIYTPIYLTPDDVIEPLEEPELSEFYERMRKRFKNCEEVSK